MPGGSLKEIYKLFEKAYGDQKWWPGDSRFEIIVGAILTQNTAWSNVEKAITNLKTAKTLNPTKIALARQNTLAKLLKPAGYFNVKAKRLKAFCKWLQSQGGVRALARRETNQLRIDLLNVYGIGPETADDILLYAFGRPVFVIDAYTRRIYARLGLINGKESYEALRHKFETALGPNAVLYNQYHALIVRHAKERCRTKPACATCCTARICHYNLSHQ